MRRVVLLGLLVVALGTGLLAGLQGDPAKPIMARPSPCSLLGCIPTGDDMVIVACEWDWGCFFNPFEPDGQWWCYPFWGVHLPWRFLLL